MVCIFCNGEQKLPLKREDGTIVPHTYVYCKCKEDEPIPYQEPKPEDFDFACSDSFRGYYQETYGDKQDRIIERELLEAQKGNAIEVVEAPGSQPWTKRQQYQIDQTKAELVALRIKLAELFKQRKVPFNKAQPKKSTYQGLVVKSETH